MQDGSEDREGSRQGNLENEDSESEQQGLKIAITGIMNVKGEIPIANRTRSKQTAEGPPRSWPTPEQVEERSVAAKHSPQIQLNSGSGPGMYPLIMGNQGQQISTLES